MINPTLSQVYATDDTAADGHDGVPARIVPISGKMWAKQGENYFPCETAVATMPAGFYIVQRTNAGQSYFTESIPVIDELYDVPDSPSEDIIKQIEQFWKSEEKFKSRGLVWKRGVLLWGPAGTGKTSVIHLIARRVIKDGGIVIFGDLPHVVSDGLRQFRLIEPKRPILLILEDIDSLVNHYEGALLALLDGEVQVDNIVIIATTNYVEKLDPRVVDRPRRIDVIQKIDAPSAAARRFYLTRKVPELATKMMEIDVGPARDNFEKAQTALTDRIATMESDLEEKKAAAASDPLMQTKYAKAMTTLEEGITKVRNELKALIDKHTATIEPKSVLEYIVDNTEGLGLSHLTEIVISAQVFDTPIEKVIDRMKKMHSVKLNRNSNAATNI